jgi:hypothetical protein
MKYEKGWYSQLRFHGEEYIIDNITPGPHEGDLIYILRSLKDGIISSLSVGPDNPNTFLFYLERTKKNKIGTKLKIQFGQDGYLIEWAEILGDTNEED